jgi:hypothetical protein
MKKTKQIAPEEPEIPEEESSFIAAKSDPELFGEPLRKYSPSRKVAAQSMGCLWPLIGEEGADQMSKTGMYPGLLKDMAIVLWLCSQKDASELTKDDIRAGAWTPSRALDKPKEALAAALQWAEDNEVTEISGSRFAEGLGIFMGFATAIEASRFTVHDPNATDDDEGPKV